MAEVRNEAINEVRKEYIERNHLAEALIHMAKYQIGERQQGILGVVGTIKKWKTADVVEVRCGEWTAKMYTAHCSCGKSYKTAKYECSVCKRIADMQPYGLNFCPNCGAYMRGETNEKM